MKTRQAKQQKLVLQVVTLPKVSGKTKLNGKVNGHLGKNNRSFEDRFNPRYSEMPVFPEGLPEPLFSESSNRILKERYLLKGGNLEAVETVAERFWHIAYDIASADFDFNVSSKEVFETARDFYTVMVKQQFLPNSPTIMNAGKQNQLQYSACFVLPIDDSIPAIFDTMKYAALIHQTGGGCLSGDSRVWTTFCGIEPIGTLFMRATVDGRKGIKQGNGVAYDVSDLNIKTVSMDPATGATGLKKVSHVWEYDVPKDKQVQVTTVEGVSIQTSSWHPFMVVRGTQIVEVSAENLKEGDVILGPEKADGYWPWQEQKKAGQLVIDEDIAWLIGFTLGDGSFGYVPALRQYRVRWFSGTEDVLKKVQIILSKKNIQLSIQKDKRGLFSLATLNQRFVHDLLEACGLEKFGPKDNLIRVPEIIAKSPLSCVRAFIAGLLDSDGYVAEDGSPSYCTVSGAMADDLASLVSLLGFRPKVCSKAPYGKGKQCTYSVQICPLPQVNELATELSAYLANVKRLNRLQSSSKKQTALPLDFTAFRDELAKLGLVKKRFDKVGGSGPLAKELNYWASHRRIDRNSVLSIANVVAPYSSKLAEFLQRIARCGHQIKSVQQAGVAKPYYDLSVEDWNTYAAGTRGMVMIHNTGFAFSRLRPAGSIVKRSGGVASGPVSFLRVYDAATQSIKQGGTRRGANMGILRIDHPDILEFIRCKAVLDEQNQPVFDGVKDLLPDDNSRNLLKTLLLDRQISNFNISAAVTDKFMEAYYKGEEYELIDPHTKEVTGRLDAKVVFDEIVERAWNTGDPGLIFIDRINKSPSNPVSSLETIESTNPCGEQPLAPWDACNLGSINLGKFVKEDGSDADWEGLRKVTHQAVHFLDNVVQVNPYTLPEIYEEVHKNRRIGLGVMGWADMLFKLKVSYDSEQALELAEKVMNFINDEGHKMSEELAQKRGPFPNWENSIYSDKNNPSFKNRGESYAYSGGRPIRNSTITTIAPTGTISIIGDCSSGIEPVFALAYIHRAKGDGGKTGNEMRYLTIANKTFTEIGQKEGFYNEELAQKVMDHGSVTGVDDVPADWQRVFVTAPEIAPDWHVKMQAAFQRYTDNGVSKTINLPNSATLEDIKKAYLMAWETGCSGITVYRDGSKTTQVLNVSSTLKPKTQEVEEVSTPSPVAGRPMVLRGRTYKVATPVGEAYITLNRDENNQPFEVFVTVGRGGMHTMADAEAMGRLMSLSLRLARSANSVDPTAVALKIVSQLRGIGGASHVGFGKDRVMSLADAIAKVLAEDLALDAKPEAQEIEPLPLNLVQEEPAANTGSDDVVRSSSMAQADLCPECGNATFVREDGCQKCYSCGYSKC
ncbi:adenosylcobalamin-dependent ribonucleoside-diphosphate reductase [Candidatus Daviesbacteria bacterium]|nr:adenosylcobalamin-dependent ribonucleoside-diphosphate reductase [Candidatus Daviesbacteria bacterium]